MSKRLLIALIVCLPAMAQTEAPARVGVGMIRQEMTLAAAIERAMSANLDIEIIAAGVTARR